VKIVIEALAEKENKKGDIKVLENLTNQYSNEIKQLTFRILDELLQKELRT
jgi:hypothetical protein